MAAYNTPYTTFQTPRPNPTVTPYKNPQQGGSPNVPVGQTGTPYSQGFIGPIQPQFGAAGSKVSDVNFNQPTMMSTQYPTTQYKAPDPTPVPTPSPSGGGISDAQYDARGVARGDSGGYERVSREQQAQQSNQEGQIRGEINQGYDAYQSSLDQLLGNISGQKQGQQQIVESNYQQGLSDIGAQRTSSQQDLTTSSRKNQEQQVKSLTDIADNIRNLFKTGNVMLGTRGAGDSSAANQYSYATTKLGSKQRGDVMAQTRSIENDIADRSSKLNNIVTQETAKLKTERDNQIVQVAQWFQDKQDQLIQAKGQGQLQRGQSLAQLSTQLLQQAQQYLMQQDAQYKNQQNTLMSWAATNAKTIGELKNNLASVGQYNVPGINTGQLPGMQFNSPTGQQTGFGQGGFNENEKLNIFGGQ